MNGGVQGNDKSNNLEVWLYHKSTKVIGKNAFMMFQELIEQKLGRAFLPVQDAGECDQGNAHFHLLGGVGREENHCAS